MSLKRFHGLDILRSFAILSIILLHGTEIIHDLPQSLNYIFLFGWSGVDLFFVLSGFLIGRQVFSNTSQLSNSSELKKFWIKRWFRTVPLYFFFLILYIVIKPALGYPFNGWNFSFLIFLQNYFKPSDFIQSWSLCIEEQFYLVFPLLFYFLNFKVKSPLIWLVPLVVSFFSRLYLYENGTLDGITRSQLAYLIDFPTHTHLDGISLGVFLAGTYNYWAVWPQKIRLLLSFFGLLLLILTFSIAGPMLENFSSVYIFTVCSFCFSIILLGVHDLSLPLFIHWPFLKLAELSYGIYLWNNFVMRLFDKIHMDLHWSSRLLIFFVVSAALAFFTYHLIEKYFLKVRDKILLSIK